VESLIEPSQTVDQPSAGELMPWLDTREEATRSLVDNGWQRLYSAITPRRASVTLLDPSESLQISLQIPVDSDSDASGDWDLWIEACHKQLSLPLRTWLEEQGLERSTLSRLSGTERTQGEEPLDLKTMLQVARWLQGPIETIEQLAKANNSQLVLHLAGLGLNS